MPARCFVAIDLPAPTRHLLGGVDRAIVRAQPAWAGEKWVRSELRHVTLKFAGPIPDGAVSGILDALMPVLEHLPPPELRLSGVRAMPSARRASMLWAVFDDDLGRCSDLAAACDAVLAERLGLDPETRPFRPHTTLARARSTRALSIAALESARGAIQHGKDTDRTVSVRSVTLFSSTLRPEGPEYAVLGTVPLGG